MRANTGKGFIMVYICIVCTYNSHQPHIATEDLKCGLVQIEMC